MHGQTIDLFDPAIREDPFPTYHRMRTDAPVCRVEPGGFYALTRYDDIVAAFRDTETYSSSGFRAVLAPAWVGRNPSAESLIVLDPPVHTRQRSLVSRAFITSVVSALQPFIEARVGELLDEIERSGGEPVDLVTRLGTPLAGSVIAPTPSISIASPPACWPSAAAPTCASEPTSPAWRAASPWER
ncbi:MAG TPA: hypothetical protein VK922_05655 [Gemmatimonadaceae bacterium]|nr:hypothetical protein [Gemmatimonadaceae bacterium]